MVVKATVKRRKRIREKVRRREQVQKEAKQAAEVTIKAKVVVVEKTKEAMVEVVETKEAMVVKIIKDMVKTVIMGKEKRMNVKTKKMKKRMKTRKIRKKETIRVGNIRAATLQRLTKSRSSSRSKIQEGTATIIINSRSTSPSR